VAEAVADMEEAVDIVAAAVEAVVEVSSLHPFHPIVPSLMELTQGRW